MVMAPRLPGQPINSCKLTNNNNKDKPVMTSGMTKGAASIPVKNSLPLKFAIRVSASPASVPKIVAKVALMAATCKLNKAASIICSSSNRAVYQRVEKPPHTDISLESLNE